MILKMHFFEPGKIYILTQDSILCRKHDNTRVLPKLMEQSIFRDTRMRPWLKKLVSQQYRAWSDCTDIQSGLALYCWQRHDYSLSVPAGYRLHMSTFILFNFKATIPHMLAWVYFKMHCHQNIKLNHSFIYLYQTRILIHYTSLNIKVLTLLSSYIFKTLQHFII